MSMYTGNVDQESITISVKNCSDSEGFSDDGTIDMDESNVVGYDCFLIYSGGFLSMKMPEGNKSGDTDAMNNKGSEPYVDMNMTISNHEEDHNSTHSL